MTHPRLTGTQSSVLFVLMARAEEVRNPDLARFGPELKKPDREKLVGAGLVEVGRDGRAMTVSLTDAGWAWCAEELGHEPPDRATPQLKALYTVLAGLGRHLTSSDRRIYEVFTAEDPAAAPSTTQTSMGVSVVDRIRDAYGRRASRPGSWVSLAVLRADLTDLDHADFDDAVRALEREAGVGVIPQEDQGRLTPADRDSAVVIGSQRCHLISIDAR
ncbi:MarR family transcriptional regulator [uncultured Williamsia sp.]|uniref:MarR family transcriptional regulator n=1 Tax=uncultured Williamsia sp. TaxID=259311 RepID=UPI0026294E6F|nr:MarR family transcriptional regulator [uncultured Williamsia sp.]